MIHSALQPKPHRDSVRVNQRGSEMLFLIRHPKVTVNELRPTLELELPGQCRQKGIAPGMWAWPERNVEEVIQRRVMAL